jgi:UDP-N-acetylmuramoyl-L-alanyl-D-glutamate--2,6-diaminopimelate ligase
MRTTSIDPVKASRLMFVSDLLSAAGELVVSLDDDDVAVTGLAFDSRRVGSGNLFFCIPGALSDGHLFAAEAVASGAVTLCVERRLDVPVPQIVVSDARKAMARMAAAWFDWPASEMLLLGVTGTNGKTTTAFLLESILVAAGRAPGLIGTIETRWANKSRPGIRTTPESVDLQRLFDEMRGSGVDSVAMEVTSHALSLHRVEGVRFDVATFTNLSQDHLDFHSSMDEYWQAKKSLFTPERAHRGAVNVDDEHGRALAQSSDIPLLTYGIAPDAEVRALDVRLGPHCSEFVLGGPTGEQQVATRLAGRFNIANCLAAAATAIQADIELPAIAGGINSLRAVPGRFETVDSGQPFAVIVDYAHTPDSLDNVLRSARSLASSNGGRVLCVFGCGGDRDRSKRPLMGIVAARLSDFVVVTSDNPRSEEPQSILDEILEGVVATKSSGPDVVSVDRREAIRQALEEATPGDAVVIAGKGHETGQQFSDLVVPFDDREVARSLLAELNFEAEL